MTAIAPEPDARRRRPASHPVLQRAAFRAALDDALEATPSQPTVSVTTVNDQAARIEDLAQRVVLMPDTPLTGQQRRSLLILARELYRRATVDAR